MVVIFVVFVCSVYLNSGIQGVLSATGYVPPQRLNILTTSKRQKPIKLISQESPRSRFGLGRLGGIVDELVEVSSGIVDVSRARTRLMTRFF